VTVVHEPVARPTGDEPEVLFHEARLRRRRRWLTSGITILVVALVLGLIVGLLSNRTGKGTPTAGRLPAPVAVVHSGVALSFRPVLCYVPALTLAPGQAASAGPLPACSASAVLTPSNLQVSPNSDNVNGYTSNPMVHADPRFSAYHSTIPADDKNNETVLLPGAASMGPTRYVLGPAGLTQQGVQSASAQYADGQWTVDLVLTPQGSTEWDTLTQHQFHALIGVVLNGKVISAPIIQPIESSWSSFNGQVQISGSFTQQQAKAIARET
jgi:hypothetical protein